MFQVHVTTDQTDAQVTVSGAQDPLQAERVAVRRVLAHEERHFDLIVSRMETGRSGYPKDVQVHTIREVHDIVGADSLDDTGNMKEGA